MYARTACVLAAMVKEKGDGL